MQRIVRVGHGEGKIFRIKALQCGKTLANAVCDLGRGAAHQIERYENRLCASVVQRQRSGRQRVVDVFGDAGVNLAAVVYGAIRRYACLSPANSNLRHIQNIPFRSVLRLSEFCGGKAIAASSAAIVTELRNYVNAANEYFEII